MRRAIPRSRIRTLGAPWAALLAIGTAGWPAASVAVGPETEAGARLDVGYDSNPLRISTDGPNGSFLQLRFDGALHFPLGATSRLFVDAEGRQRLHEGGTSNADWTNGELRVGVSLAPDRGRLAQWAIAAGASYRMNRSTFTDRFTGEVYEVAGEPADDPQELVAVPDRFDHESVGLFLQARYRIHRRLQAIFEGRWEDASYGKDYGTTTSLDPLDQSTLTLEPGLLFKVNDRLAFGASVVWDDVDYDAYPALDADGDEVPGSRREYRLTELRVAAHVRPGAGLRLRLGYNGGDRADTHAGYYDYGVSSVFADAERDFPRVGTFSVQGQLRDLEYDVASVPGATDEALRGNELERFSVRFRRKLNPSLGLFAETGRQRVDSRDIEFAYDRDWWMTGIEYRQRSHP